MMHTDAIIAELRFGSMKTRAWFEPKKDGTEVGMYETVTYDQAGKETGREIGETGLVIRHGGLEKARPWWKLWR